MSKQVRADNLTICYCKKQIIRSYDRSARQPPCGSTATLTMLWWSLSSITGQTYENLTLICLIENYSLSTFLSHQLYNLCHSTDNIWYSK